MKIHNFFLRRLWVCVCVIHNVYVLEWEKGKKETKWKRSCFQWCCFFLLLIVHTYTLDLDNITFSFQFMYPPPYIDNVKCDCIVFFTSHSFCFVFISFMGDPDEERVMGERKNIEEWVHGNVCWNFGLVVMLIWKPLQWN